MNYAFMFRHKGSGLYYSPCKRIRNKTNLGTEGKVWGYKMPQNAAGKTFFITEEQMEEYDIYAEHIRGNFVAVVYPEDWEVVKFELGKEVDRYDCK